MIQFVENKDIDKQKWDDLVENSANGFIYASSFHLDLMAKNWNALILDDYQAVLPLPVKKKLGIRYVMQPHFSQQLGVISNENNPFYIDDFIKELKKKYKFFALNLNYNNNLKSNINFFEYTNQIIDLKQNYEKIQSNYSKNTIRNLKKIDSGNFKIKINSISINDFFEIFKNNLPDKNLKIYLKSAQKILDFYSKSKFGKIISIHNGLDNRILSIVLILSYNKRHIYLLPVSSKEGKESKSMFYLIDYFIKENANTDFVLDFEGSNFEGIQRFYKSFGAVKQNYLSLYNKPFFL